MNEATYDDLTSPAQMSDPLNTTNSESKYIKFGMKQLVTVDQEIFALGNFQILNSCTFYFCFLAKWQKFLQYLIVP